MKRFKRGLAFALATAMAVAGNGIPENALTVARAAEPDGSDYESFTSDLVVKDFKFGQDITASTVYDESTGYGFSKVEFPEEAPGWVGGVYNPRVEKKTVSDASYVEAQDGCLAISSKVWTETESSGYGVYTYEETATFDYMLPNADYSVEVTLVNPTENAYSAYLESEDITKVSSFNVAPGAQETKTFTACLIDGKLNLKFLGTSSTTTQQAAELQKVYVSEVKITRLKTNDRGTKPTIFIASDSTAQTYDEYYYPQTGWGQTLAQFFGDDLKEYECENCGYSQSQSYETENVVVENRSIGGRSSSSFVQEGKLDDLLEDVKPGDFLLIQWGHNDDTTTRPNRYVPLDQFDDWLQVYVDGALQRGATPVLVTPVSRNSYTKDANGNVIYNISFDARRGVMQSMSAEQGIPLVDLGKRSKDVADSFGASAERALWLFTDPGDYTGAYAGGVSDSTHLQYYGAYKFAQCVAKGLKTLGADTENYPYEAQNAGAYSAQLSMLADKIDLKEATTAPGEVTGLAPTSVGATSIKLGWNKVDGSEYYYIYRAVVESQEEGEAYTFPDDAERYALSTSATFTDTKCESGKTYVYKVCGWNNLGTGVAAQVAVTTKEAGFKYDFNYDDGTEVSTTQNKWNSVTQNQLYDAELGYGWIKAPGKGAWRKNATTAVTSGFEEVAKDFNVGSGEFAVDLPNGDYEVTIYAADLSLGTAIKPSYTIEGEAFGTISSTKQLGSVTGQVRVLDGQMNVKVGGAPSYINGLTITEILKAPTGLTFVEKDLNGSNYALLIGYNGVDEAKGYRIYQKATSDSTFKMIREMTVDEIREDELGFKALSIPLGENYQFYLTCYLDDGTESAPSNILSLDTLDPTVTPPAAPVNVVCTSPAEGSTELATEISLAWDAVQTTDEAHPVIKYVIYRSEKAEDEKGFTGFVKVGESTTTTYTDTTAASNVPHYYKVAALNLGGVGALSEVCASPVVGKLTQACEEKLTDRALYAIQLSDSVKGYSTDGKELTDGVYLSWRAFEEEFTNNKLNTTFTVYVNDKEVKTGLKATNVVLTDVPAGASFKVVGADDAEINGGLTAKSVKAIDQQYVEMQLYKPANDMTPDGVKFGYTANDMSVGDIDGDGNLDLIVKWYPDNAQDNSKQAFTGKTYLDAYTVNWNTGAVQLISRIDLGINIRSGAHYTQFQVWDFDGDGKVELAAKTADGSTIYKSTDGTDKTLTEVAYVGACNSEALPCSTKSESFDYRNATGMILDGHEYFSMFNLDDGTILDTVDYIPGRGKVADWGDSYGNRVDRFLSATAYLDGIHPFAVMCRGYYTRTALTAYGTTDTNGDGIGDKIYTYWAYDTDNGDGPEGQGNHNLSVADIDHDGCDEIIYGSSSYDHNGKLKYSTGYGHGDAIHVSDWVSWNDGQEIMTVHEEFNQEYQVDIHDAETGKVIIGYPVKDADVGRGVASDIDPTSIDAEFWASNAPDGTGSGEWDSTDSAVLGTNGSDTTKWNYLSKGSTPAANGTMYWDGDLLAEIQDHKFNNKNGAYDPIGVLIAKWDYENNKQVPLLYSEEIFSSNGTKGNLGLIVDLTGDWRDEFIARCSADATKIRLYQTTYVTDYVIPCSLDDLQYREAVAWENVGYNQPPHTSYMISKGLVTAQLSEGTKTDTSEEIKFTPACDGTLYGHEVEGYEIYLATVNDGVVSEYTKAGTAAADATSYTINGLTAGKTYSVKIAAVVNGRTSFNSRPLEIVAKADNTSGGGTTGGGTTGGSTSGGSSSGGSVSGGASVSKDDKVESGKSTVTEEKVNSAGNKAEVTTTTTAGSDGKAIKTLVVTTVADETSGAEITVKTTTNKDGKVTSSVATVNKTATGNKLTLGNTVAQITEAAGAGVNTALTVKAVDAKGKLLYTVKAQTEDLKAGDKLSIYKQNTLTGEYTLVNGTSYKVGSDGSVSVKMTEKATYVLMNSSDAKKINTSIAKTVKAAKSTANVNAGKKVTFKMKSTLNQDNVKSITYKVSNSKLASVTKSGVISAKKAGKVTVTATVTLKNGTKVKTKMAVTVKK